MRTLTLLFTFSLLPFALNAQDAGLRGAAQELPQVARLGPPDPATAERVITIEAVAEVRVMPSQLRVVFAVSGTGESATAASAAVKQLLATTRAGLLAVDYWSDTLAAKQIEAQQKALAAAQQKAKLLLTVFPEPPTPINVHETTRVLFPQNLYQRLARAEDNAAAWYSDNLPRVPASRPLQVYYRGLFADVDAVEKVTPGPREIEIVSTVRLYYEAPGRPQQAK